MKLHFRGSKHCHCSKTKYHKYIYIYICIACAYIHMYINVSIDRLYTPYINKLRLLLNYLSCLLGCLLYSLRLYRARCFKTTQRLLRSSFWVCPVFCLGITTWTSKRAQNNGPTSQNREYRRCRVQYFGHTLEVQEYTTQRGTTFEPPGLKISATTTSIPLRSQN